MKHTKCYLENYPRPQLVRGDWTDLNGKWRFAFGEEVTLAQALEGELPRTILVPFSYETKRSGIGDTAAHPVVWYARRICGKKGKRTLLHFEGADYTAEIFLGGRFAGRHTGAYSRFTLDVTDFVTEDGTLLAVKCTDENLPEQVRGKQRWREESFGCWYVQTTGIYKSVWLEYVDELYLTSLKITPSVRENSVTFDVSVSRPAQDVRVRIAVSLDGRPIQETGVLACDCENSVTVRLDSRNETYQAAYWTPDCPRLYDVELFVERGGKVCDRAGSYFGLRDYRAAEGKLLLNDHPFYARLVLDQGYWGDSGLTPPDEAALARDILLAKEMGFNGVRKHQKTEDERFFYYADVLGFTVWCELPSNHWFCDGAVQQIAEEWLGIVRQNYNHPSLVTWVAFNESWGVRGIARDPRKQALSAALYHLTKSIDPMRPVISNDGWLHTQSDILTLHNYEQDAEAFFKGYSHPEGLVKGAPDLMAFAPFAEGYSYQGQPIVISEWGGTAFTKDKDRGWGYGSGAGDEAEFLSRFASLAGAIADLRVSGYCYTQLTDVEHEVNGLLYADRTPKVPLGEIAKRNK